MTGMKLTLQLYHRLPSSYGPCPDREQANDVCISEYWRLWRFEGLNVNGGYVAGASMIRHDQIYL
jgi:hypothetical protein